MVSESRYRPYVPPANFVNLLHRLRTRNLPEVINAEYLTASSFSSAIASRILGALRFLDLIRESGEPEDTLRSLARSTDEEYRQLLEGIVREAYRDVFQSADPSKDPQDAIINAFRRYEPASQHYRMAILFLGLCREAGIPILEEPRRRERQRPVQRRSPGAGTTRETPSVRGKSGGGTQVGSAPASSSPVLWGYFQRLPKPGSIFPLEEQEAWLESIKSAFRLEYRTGETGTEKAMEGE